jgi:hypothetical protein
MDYFELLNRMRATERTRKNFFRESKFIKNKKQEKFGRNQRTRFGQATA